MDFFGGGGVFVYIFHFLAHKTPSYDTKMLLKVVSDKTALAKFEINNNFEQNIDATHSKEPKIHWKILTSLWILKTSRKKIRKPKVSRLLPNLCDFQ
jgi:hypothetical protein